MLFICCGKQWWHVTAGAVPIITDINVMLTTKQWRTCARMYHAGYLYICSLFILHHVNPMDLPLDTKVVFKPYQTLYSDVQSPCPAITATGHTEQQWMQPWHETNVTVPINKQAIWNIRHHVTNSQKYGTTSECITQTGIISSTKLNLSGCWMWLHWMLWCYHCHRRNELVDKNSKAKIFTKEYSN